MAPLRCIQCLPRPSVPTSSRRCGHDTHQLRLLSKLLHARSRQCFKQRSNSVIAQSPSRSSHPNMVLTLRLDNVALRLHLVPARRQTTSPLPLSFSAASALLLLLHSAAAALLLLTWLLLGAPLVLSCYCRLTFLVRASDLELGLASSISMTLQFPCACRTP